LRIHLVNPSDLSFGTAVITPRWLYVLAAATPAQYGDPLIVDETLEQIDPETVKPGDVVGIGIHTGNVLRGYKVGQMARERGATVVYGGGGVGLMGSLADAALARDGHVIGIIPRFMTEVEWQHPGLAALEVVEDMRER